MKKALIDVPVLLLFFVRPDTFRKVFEQVKEARPSKLFLFQDGAREGRPGDAEKIEECRKIAEDIDWECEVHTYYSEKNLTCDHAEYTAISWAFKYVDRLIILEDDIIPSQSFFRYCYELLEKYINDSRIQMIAGLNHLDDSSRTVSESYFFSKVISVWGWATWKEKWERCDTSFDYIKHEEFRKLILDNIQPKSWAKFQLARAEKTYNQFKENGTIYSWELMNAMAMHLNSSYAIVPVKNMISNIGITEDSTHNVNDIRKLPKGIRWIFNMKRYELEFPLKHPKYVMENKEYRRKTFSKMARNNKLKQFYRKVEGKIRRIIIQ